MFFSSLLFLVLEEITLSGYSKIRGSIVPLTYLNLLDIANFLNTFDCSSFLRVRDRLGLFKTKFVATSKITGLLESGKV